MKLSQPLLFLALALTALSSHALESSTPSDKEMASLPDFCKAKYKGGPESKNWASALGKDYWHTHHYCAGINYLNRYYRARSGQDKKFNLNNARTNLEYMVSHAAPTFSLMPDVYSNLGTVYSLMNEPGQAISYFNKAIELDPRQPKVYNALSDYYAKTKQSVKALEIVTTGLRYNPDTKSLQRRYTELGGKLPYPAPMVPAMVEQQAAKPDDTTASTPTMPAEPTKNVQETITPVVEPIAPPRIGTPTNPYCRFCPD